MKSIKILCWLFALLVYYQGHGQNLALDKQITASTIQDPFIAANAVDGSSDTRWASDYVSPSWIKVDLEETYSIKTVVLSWEAASASHYYILASDTDIDPDPAIWTVLAEETDMGSGERSDVLEGLAGSGRYIAVYAVEKEHDWGYSLWEFEVYDQDDVQNTAPVSNAGEDVTLSASTSSYTLDGIASYDPDEGPDALSYSWSQFSGSAVTIVSPNAVTTEVTGLASGGVYVFQLTVNDGQNSATSSVKITVLSSSGCGTENIALDKEAFASTYQGNFYASYVTDGDLETRWGSEFSDDEWIGIDLEDTFNICQVELYWEAAYGASYEVRLGFTDDIDDSEVIASIDDSDGGEDLLITDSNVAGQFLWIKGISRALVEYGYSLFEVRVYGGENTTEVDTEAPTNPTNLSASAAVYAVTLSWGAASDNVGVESYKVFEGTTLKATIDGSSNSMTISGLEPGTTYTYTVKAYDQAGNASSGVDVTFQTEENSGSEDGAIGIGNLALSLPVTASSVVDGSTNVADFAVDGNITSRWESAFTDDEWITVDLGQKYQIGRIILHWETASGKHYLLQVSDDNENWETIYEFENDTLAEEERTDDLLVSGAGQYVRMQGIERNTQWSYSLFEFEVYSPGSGPDDIPDPNPNPNPDPVPPGPSTFTVITPTDGFMVTDTRRPTLAWNASSGASSYEVWVNITKTDYDWEAWGSLLDRFTKMADVEGTSYTLTEPLSDRWTYKWYVVAVSDTGVTYSDVGQFSVYLPEVEQVDDDVDLIDGCRDLNKNGSIEPYENWKLTVSERVSDLMSRMTDEEKAFQMFYNAQAYPISGWAFGPGTVNDMFEKQKASAATRLGIPFVSAGDCIHGYSTTYPTQSTMAASRNLDIVRQCGNVQREEQLAVGFRGTLAPLAEVGTKVLYPRIQEGCGEDADYAASMVRAMVCGLQNGPELNPGSVMVTTKHWPGEGAGGEAGIVYDGVTIKYHMKPWFANVDAGAGSVMPGYAGSSFLDPGGPGAGDSKPILDYLRDVVGFEGVICTDWLPYGSWADAANAGSDVMGGADPGVDGFSMDSFIAEVGMDRINEAVERILSTKYKLGVFEDPYGDPVDGPDTWFTDEHVEIVTQAAREAMTLLTNDGVLPLDLPAGSNLLVTGARADDGESHSIWTSYFHDEYGAKTMFEAIQEKATAKGINATLHDATDPDAAIVILGEPTYTHGTSWDDEKPYIHDAYYEISDTYEYDSTTLSNVQQMGIPYVVVVIMPRPYVLTDVINDANAVMIAYRPGDGGGPALADVLFGDYVPNGKLPWQLPRSLDQIGKDKLSEANERWDIPFDLGATSAEIQEIRTKIANGEHIEPIYGDPLFQYGYGLSNYGTDMEARTTSEADETLDEALLSDEFKMYPNPVTDMLNIVLEQNGIAGHYQVISAGGKLVQSGNEASSTFSIDTQELPRGMYIIHIENVGATPKAGLFFKK